jgi:DNA segregation ATPase FtsK/SpoIIIE, S-DNA-T family
LILSDERNQAARFLSRPGEAIYNDQNGLVSANQPFQVVWLSDGERAEYLEQVAQLAAARGVTPEPPIVFEGNAPADPRQNRQLVLALSEANPAAPMATDVAIEANPFAHHAWLGSAVSIKPPTFVTFARHGGSNLMLLGQQGPAALGILTNMAIALAGQSRRAQVPVVNGQLPSLLVLDGTRPGEPGEQVWGKVVQALGDGAQLVATRDVATTIARVAEELTRRDAESDETAPSIYLVVYNAARFRDLRKGEEDFSFSISRDKPEGSDKQLAEILKNGPAWGIHTLIWCDGYNSVSRLFDRVAMREFEIRIALQMSAADSSNFIDTPAASKLSPHRALLYNDETGQSELFRPYGIPDDEWLAQVAAIFGAERPTVG